MAASSSSCGGQAREEVYLTVQFEDGAERGLLADVVDDDVCDPHYWHFAEVHGRKPRAKVLFPDGVAMYIAEKPSAHEGTVIDEDGDPHGFLREEGGSAADRDDGRVAAAVAAAAPGAELAAAAAPPRKRLRGLGGWGHAVRESTGPAAEDGVEEEDDDQEDFVMLPGQSRRRDEDSDEDWVEGRHRRNQGARRAKKRRLSRVAEEEEEREAEPARSPEDGRGERAAEAGEALGHSVGAAEPAAAAPGSGQALGDTVGNAEPAAAAPGSGQAIREELGGTSGAPEPEAREVPVAEAAPGTEPSIAEPATEDVGVEEGTEEVVQESSSAAGARPAGAEGGSAGTAEASQAAADALGSSMSFNRAKTARANCRSCGEAIKKDELRYGMRGYAGGRTVTFFAHVRCFQERVNVEYVTARRGKCKGTGVAFEPGEIRVGFDVGGHKSWWSPEEAARWTSLASAEGQALPAPGSLEALDEEHREPLLQLLRDRTAPTCELRRAMKATRSRRTPRAGAAAKAPAGASPSRGSAAAPAGAAVARAAGDAVEPAGAPPRTALVPAAGLPGAERSEAAAPGDDARGAVGDEDSDLEVQRVEVQPLREPLDLDAEVGCSSGPPRILDEESDLEVVLAS